MGKFVCQACDGQSCFSYILPTVSCPLTYLSYSFVKCSYLLFFFVLFPIFVFYFFQSNVKLMRWWWWWFCVVNCYIACTRFCILYQKNIFINLFLFRKIAHANLSLKYNLQSNTKNTPYDVNRNLIVSTKEHTVFFIFLPCFILFTTNGID